ncbi:hypothetical protein J6590_079044 [Homalodisca vitripennis]|nr:hypothetical protein J6590_079044 [Homalodisca vitripennis]
MAMGSPLSPIFASIFMEEFERKGLASAQFKPKIRWSTTVRKVKPPATRFLCARGSYNRKSLAEALKKRYLEVKQPSFKNNSAPESFLGGTLKHLKP